MRAAVYDRYGPPQVLRAGTVHRPEPGPREVLVKVHAASVNGGELLARAGKVKFVTSVRARGWPKRLGLDFAGEVEAVGREVRDTAVGDRVWGMMPRSKGFGSMAEYVVTAADMLSPGPAGVDLVEAAALPVVGTTVLTALRDKARLAKGERLLVRGASGGIGSIAVQLGHAYGAHVTALAGARNLDFVRELGADEVFDHRVTAPGDLGSFDVVLDSVGTDHAAWRRLLSPRGRMVAVSFDSGRPVRSILTIAGSTVHGSRRIRFFSGNPGREDFVELARLTETGAIRPVVDTVHPLDDVARSHEALEAGGVRGKHVIRML
ncbi:NAD(P)-dependent alcohol dehydrogenase [Streptomyces triticagri]|uniref:NAD(P)-dependent alcohol dehydrogenase n=1 Tax=Streptomyces triticagri TaxID=2293568 RepID=A0A372LXR1_9ACTN|nr:NAD(P)-dependent alcohol dehydrogenase [Streptomyces triticagri]RFU83458.1 NAD(P)-dependent alcohol dehydrogenase [Streptomyces triticagri]